MNAAALESYLAGWRDANAGRAAAWLFLRPAERRVFGAWAALEHEWIRALREVSAPQVAAAKLGWWREEMQRAGSGAASHPLTQALFAEPRICSVPSARWLAAIDAAMLEISLPPAADFAAQQAALRPLATALASLDDAIWFPGRRPDVTLTAEILLTGRLLADLRGLGQAAEQGRTALPMQLLARYGLSIDTLASDSPARRAALRDYLHELLRAVAALATMQGPLGLFRAVQWQHDWASLQRAVGADEPLAALLAGSHGFGALLKTWRAARMWRGQVLQGKIDATS